MWIKGNYRRNLMDMHIDDWNPEFLSRINVKEYVEALKDAWVQTLLHWLPCFEFRLLCTTWKKRGSSARMHGEVLEPGIPKLRTWLHARLTDRCTVNSKRKITGEFFEQQYTING